MRSYREEKAVMAMRMAVTGMMLELQREQRETDNAILREVFGVRNRAERRALKARKAA